MHVVYQLELPYQLAVLLLFSETELFGDCLRVKILLGGISLFLLVCSSGWFICLLCNVKECKRNLLFPQQKTRGVFMTDTGKKAFLEGEEEVKTTTFIITK